MAADRELKNFTSYAWRIYSIIVSVQLWALPNKNLHFCADWFKTESIIWFEFTYITGNITDFGVISIDTTWCLWILFEPPESKHMTYEFSFFRRSKLWSFGSARASLQTYWLRFRNLFTTLQNFYRTFYRNHFVLHSSNNRFGETIICPCKLQLKFLFWRKDDESWMYPLTSWHSKEEWKSDRGSHATGISSTNRKVSRIADQGTTAQSYSNSDWEFSEHSVVQWKYLSILTITSNADCSPKKFGLVQYRQNHCI